MSEMPPQELWAKNIPPCPVCGEPACYHENDGAIACDNLNNEGPDVCPVSPAVYGDDHELRGNWDALRAVFIERDRAHRLRLESARLAYQAGHEDTVESVYSDPGEAARDICEEIDNDDEDDGTVESFDQVRAERDDLRAAVGEALSQTPPRPEEADEWCEGYQAAQFDLRDRLVRHGVTPESLGGVE